MKYQKKYIVFDPFFVVIYKTGEIDNNKYVLFSLGIPKEDDVFENVIKEKNDERNSHFFYSLETVRKHIDNVDTPRLYVKVKLGQADEEELVKKLGEHLVAAGEILYSFDEIQLIYRKRTIEVTEQVISVEQDTGNWINFYAENEHCADLGSSEQKPDHSFASYWYYKITYFTKIDSPFIRRERHRLYLSNTWPKAITNSYEGEPILLEYSNDRRKAMRFKKYFPVLIDYIETFTVDFLKRQLIFNKVEKLEITAQFVNEESDIEGKEWCFRVSHLPEKDDNKKIIAFDVFIDINRNTVKRFNEHVKRLYVSSFSDDRERFTITQDVDEALMIDDDYVLDRAKLIGQFSYQYDLYYDKPHVEVHICTLGAERSMQRNKSLKEHSCS
jgi:hypothetical protein